MVVWMIYDKEDYKKNKLYFRMHQEYSKKYNIEFVVVFSDEYKYMTSDYPDAIVMRSRNYHISEYYEKLGIPVFNNSYVSRICNDKYLTYKEVSKLGIPCIETNILDAIDTEKDTSKYVVKSVDGHGGNEVYMMKDYIELYCSNNERYQDKDSILYSDKRYIIQPFIKNSGKDLRVYVLNGNIMGCVLRTASDGFKSNYSLGGRVSSYSLSADEKEYVYKIMEYFYKSTEEHYVRGMFYVGIDFIIDENGKLLFNEIEDVVGSRMLYNTSNIDIVAYYIDNLVEYLKM